MNHALPLAALLLAARPTAAYDDGKSTFETTAVKVRSFKAPGAKQSESDRLLFSPDGHALAAGPRYSGGTLRLWDADSGLLKAELVVGDADRMKMAFTDDSTRLVIGTDHDVVVFDARSGSRLKTIGYLTAEKYSKFIGGIAGGLIAFGDKEKVRIVSTSKAKELSSFSVSSGGEASAAMPSPDGSIVIAADSRDDRLYAFDVAKEKLRASAKDPCAKRATSLAFSRDSRLLASGNGDGQICLWDSATLTLQGILDMSASWQSLLEFSPDDSALVFQRQKELVFMDVQTGKARLARPGYGTNFAASKDWSVIAVADSEGFGVWDLASGAPRVPFLKASGIDNPYSLAVSPDGEIAIAGGYDSYLIESTTGRKRFFSSGNSYYGLAFSPDGQRFAGGELAGGIDLYKLQPAEPPKVAAPNGPAKLAVAAANGLQGGALSAGKTAQVNLSISNNGSGAAYAVHLVPRVKPFYPGVLPPAEVIIETLEPGKTETRALELKTTDKLVTGTVRLKIAGTEGNGFDPSPVDLEIAAKGFEPPKLELSDLKLPDGPVQKGDAARIEVAIKNYGGGTAQGVTAALSIAREDVFLESDKPAALGDLGPGQSATVSFKVVVNNRFSGSKTLPLRMTVADQTGAFGFKARPLTLALGEPAPNVADLIASQGPELNLKRAAVIPSKGPSHVQVSNDGRWIAAVDQSSTIHVWDLQTLAEKASVSRPMGDAKNSAFSPLGFSPDGNSLLAIVEDTAYVIDVEKSRARKLWSGAPTRYETKKQPIAMTWAYNTLQAGAYSADGRTIALGGCYEKDDEAMLVDPADGSMRGLPSANACVEDVVVLPDGHTTAFGRRKGIVELWDMATAAKVASFSANDKAVNGVAVSPDGRTLGLVTNDKGAFLWDLAKGQLKATIDTGEIYDVYEPGFSPDGRWFTLTTGAKLIFFDAATGDKKADISNAYNHPYAFLPDGRIAAVQGDSIVIYNLYGAQSGVAVAPKPRAPAKLATDVAFREPTGAHALTGGDTGSLEVAVRNDGKGKAYGVRLVPTLLTPATGLKAPEAAAVGDIEPGRSAKASIKLASTPKLATQTIKLKLEAREANGFDAEPSLVEFQAKALAAPLLTIAALSIAGSGSIKVNDVNRLEVSIRNSGQGPAKGVTAELNLGDADIFPAGETRLSLGDISPGDAKPAAFQFFVNSRFKGKELPVTLTAREGFGTFGFTGQPLHLALGQPPSLKLVSIAAATGDDFEDVDTPPASRAPADPDAYAVIVGVERYRQQGLPGVDYAARDAQSVRDYLVKAMGFDARNVVLLQNESAAKTDLEKYLGSWLKNRVTTKSRVFIYYAGHGAPNPATGDSYLIPYDGDPSYTKETAYSLSDLYATLAQLPTKDVTVAIDACFSGQGKRSVIAAGARPLVTVRAGTPPGENTVVLTAAGGQQISTFYPDGQHGLMTYFLLKGLKGAADADRSGKITTAKLYAYMKPEIEREARKQNVEQSPALLPGVDALGARAERVWVTLK